MVKAAITAPNITAKFCTGSGSFPKKSPTVFNPDAIGGIISFASLISCSPSGIRLCCSCLMLASNVCESVVDWSNMFSAEPATSSYVFPTDVSDSMIFAFPSSAIVPNARAALFSLSCWFTVFWMSVTIASMTSFCVAPPCCHCLNTSSTTWLQPPVPVCTSPVFSSILLNESAIVPSTSLVVTSLIASFTLSRLYAPLSSPFCSNWKYS